MQHKNRLFHMVFIALMTAVISVVSPFSIPLPFSPVPLSLTTFVLYLSIYILGHKYSFYSTVLYLLLGIIGLPIFSGFSGGIGKLLNPTGGYLVGYLFIPLLAGYFIQKYSTKVLFCFLGMTLGTLACYFTGILWLSLWSEASLFTTISVGLLPFLPGDLCKICLALLLGPRLKVRLTNAGLSVSPGH